LLIDTDGAMKHLLRGIRAIILWSYERTTWQWDLLCVLILVFIFLTPKTWFETGELRGAAGHQNTVTATLLLPPEAIGNEGDNGNIERQVRAITGRPDTAVLAVRRRMDSQGRLAAYEVDIR
jgi:hypothetical protein